MKNINNEDKRALSYLKYLKKYFSRTCINCILFNSSECPNLHGERCISFWNIEDIKESYR